MTGNVRPIRLSQCDTGLARTDNLKIVMLIYLDFVLLMCAIMAHELIDFVFMIEK